MLKEATMWARVITLLFALGSASAIMIAGMLAQANITSNALPAPALFLLSIGLFGFATYQGVLLHDYCSQSRAKSRTTPP